MRGSPDPGILKVKEKNISVASRKNQLSDEFFKIGFMPYFLFLNSPLSRYRDRNSKSALAFLNQHMEKR